MTSMEEITKAITEAEKRKALARRKGNIRAYRDAAKWSERLRKEYSKCLMSNSTCSESSKRTTE